MATITREMDFTLVGKKANKAIFEPVFQSIYKLGTFRVMANVTSKEKLWFITNLKKILQKDNGCGWNPKDSFDIYNRTIEVRDVKVNMEMCVDEFKGTIFEQTQKSGILRTDLTGTQMGTALIMAVRQALPPDCQGLFWFGDEKSNDPFYNIMNGMWTVYLPDLVLNNLAPYVSTNSGSPLAPGATRALLSKMYKSQSQVLKGLANNKKKFYVTDSIWEGWFDDLESIGGADGKRLQTINGADTLFYRGIELVPDTTWDERMTNDIGSPDSHLALLTTPDNLILATNVQGDKNTIELWYDRKEETNDLKVKFKLGANFVHPAFFVIGF